MNGFVAGKLTMSPLARKIASCGCLCCSAASSTDTFTTDSTRCWLSSTATGPARSGTVRAHDWIGINLSDIVGRVGVRVASLVFDYAHVDIDTDVSRMMSSAGCIQSCRMTI